MSIATSSSFFVFVALIFSCTPNSKKEESHSIESQIRSSILDISNTWYPKTIDSKNGGFHSNFDKNWKKENNDEKMIVTQSRHIWSLSSLYEFTEDEKYLDWARHGASFLLNTFWDQENGGFHDRATFSAKKGYDFSSSKTAYGNSFAIYGLSTYFKVSKDSTALKTAIATFNWLNEGSYDSDFGGYFNILEADGSPTFKVKSKNELTGNIRQAQWKDMNSTIHLLEAFTSLYLVWPDDQVKDKIEELLGHLRNRIFNSEGYMTLFFESDWSRVSFLDSTDEVRIRNIHFDHVSFGHDVETAFLMLEAANVIGMEDQNLKEFCKKIVDHALANGWDEENGGFYDYGYYFSKEKCEIIRPDKVWWTQAEGLNALLLMHQEYNDQKYRGYFEQQWQYISGQLTDPKTGTWYSDGLDADPATVDKPMAHIWKGNYHNLRALINCHNMLNNKFELTNH